MAARRVPTTGNFAFLGTDAYAFDRACDSDYLEASDYGDAIESLAEERGEVPADEGGTGGRRSRRPRVDLDAVESVRARIRTVAQAQEDAFAAWRADAEERLTEKSAKLRVHKLKLVANK